MAAGMGSRFGGLKQAAKFGESQKVMLDFALEDAMGAGIDKAVFVIRLLRRRRVCPRGGIP